MGVSRIPSMYVPVALRCVLPCDHDGSIGLGFDAIQPDGAIIVNRFRLGLADAAALSREIDRVLRDYPSASQSLRSSEIPSSEESSTPGIENVAPAAKSSAACQA